MPTLYLLEFLFGVCAVIVVANQVVVPMAKGLPVFPFFRKTRKLSKELIEVKGEIADLKLEQEIVARKKLIEKAKKH